MYFRPTGRRGNSRGEAAKKKKIPKMLGDASIIISDLLPPDPIEEEPSTRELSETIEDGRVVVFLALRNKQGEDDYTVVSLPAEGDDGAMEYKWSGPGLNQEITPGDQNLSPRSTFGLDDVREVLALAKAVQKRRQQNG
ncbi:hypothetical protein HY857_01430 [Candidatus Saccharibacteria bacterium]|nr:hypothetical protein [Candidatus Saccharibacteria bacterium]